MGRPGGKVTKKLSLRPLAVRLSEILNNVNVKFVDSSIGKKVSNMVKGLRQGEVLLLENIRFYKEEEINDRKFAKNLASIADIYINDAFSTSHRKHASTYGVGEFFNHKFAGFLVDKEIGILSKIRDNPKRPLLLILGGAKITDKLNALKNLITKADKVMIGGGLSYTFLASKGLTVGDSQVEEEFAGWAKKTLDKYKNKILLPVDHVVASDIKRKSDVRVVPYLIPAGYMGPISNPI